MNKNNLLRTGLFALLLIFGFVSLVAGRGTAVQPAAFDDGPALSGMLQTQNETNEQADNNGGNESDSAKATESELTDPGLPQKDPAKDSSDAPLKLNVEGPVEEMTDVKPAEDKNRTTTESEPAKTSEIPSADKPAVDKSSQPEPPPAVEPPKPKRELSPALAALRDKTRRTLGMYEKMPFNSKQNTSSEIIDYCLALGCDAEITLLGASGEKRANGIMCLCWNYPFGGFQPLTMINGHVAARLGYGAQSRPSQLLATLALARVPASYSMRVGDSMRSVADLVESEKLSCRTGSDLSLKLVGLAYYVDNASWKNDLDQEWSLDNIIKEELAQPTLASGGAGLDSLLGLSYAVSRREKRNLPIDGQFARAKKYTTDFQSYAFSLQNSDGGWGYYLSGKGVNRDDVAALRSAGYVLEWLALSLPEDRLDDPGMAAGISYLITALNNQRYMNSLPVLSAREINGSMRALHALAIYDERLFIPSDPDQPTTEKKPATSTARRESNAGQSQ
jgi:hypothetical protein